MEKQRNRPFIVTLVAIIQFFTGLSVLAILLLCGFTSLFMPVQDPRNNVECTRSFGVFAILAGLWGGGVLIWTAWRFYSLDPLAYRLVRADAWRPQFILVTRFGKRLDDQDVRAAFGLSDSGTNNDCTRPNDSQQ